MSNLSELRFLAPAIRRCLEAQPRQPRLAGEPDDNVEVVWTTSRSTAEAVLAIAQSVTAADDTVASDATGRCGLLTKAEVVAAKLQGETHAQIARRAGVQPNAVYRALRRWRLQERHGGDRRSVGRHWLPHAEAL